MRHEDKKIKLNNGQIVGEYGPIASKYGILLYQSEAVYCVVLSFYTLGMECLFCNFIAQNGANGAPFVYEDETCVVFPTIAPEARIHLLIVPRKHIASVLTSEAGDDTIMGHLLAVSKILAKQYNVPGYKLAINVGEAGGQTMFHLHVHFMAN